MLYVNSSLLKSLASCSTKTWVRWGNELVMREHTDPGPLETGQVLHQALDAWVRGCDEEVILKRFDAAWDVTIGDTLPAQERLQRANVKLCLTHWLRQQVRKDMTILQTEAMFEVPFGTINGEEIIFYGTPDALVEWKGDIYILDHKSTGDISDDWSQQWTMDPSLQGYVWAMRELGHKVRGAFVNGIEIKRLPPWDGNMEKKCQTHKVKYKECQQLHVKGQWVGPLWWSEHRLNTWRSNVIRMIGDLQEIRNNVISEVDIAFTPMDGQWRWPGCNGGRGRAPCAYRGWCQAGRPLEGLTQMMISAPWRREEIMIGEE